MIPVPVKPERLFRNKISKRLHNSIDVWPVHDTYTAGVPDHWYSGWVSDLWIEYKYFPALPKRDINLVVGKTPKLSARQQVWLRRKYLQGRDVWVVVGFPEGAVILKNLAWLDTFKVQDMLVPIGQLVGEIEKHCGINDDSVSGL